MLISARFFRLKPWSLREQMFTCYSTNYDNPTKSSKNVRISSSIQHYLKNVRQHEIGLSEHRLEYELGRKHLARMMGLDEDVDPAQIANALDYLLPTSLAAEAKPIMTRPENLRPNTKSLQCSEDGRPFHSLYYTGQPNYYALMHDAAVIIEKLKQKEDEYIRKSIKPNEDNEFKSFIARSTWISQEKLEKKISEKLDKLNYHHWKLLMERLVEQTYANFALKFIEEFRELLYEKPSAILLPEPQMEASTGRYFVESYGQKKRALARVTLYMPGEGKFMVNDQSLLEAFPELGNREQLMFPLLLLDKMDKVDIIATVQDSGSGSQANALRLAISRALACFVSEADRERLRLAGLLTIDDRFPERKWPGQPKARKKFIWKAR